MYLYIHEISFFSQKKIFFQTKLSSIWCMVPPIPNKPGLDWGPLKIALSDHSCTFNHKYFFHLNIYCICWQNNLSHMDHVNIIFHKQTNNKAKLRLYDKTQRHTTKAQNQVAQNTQSQINFNFNNESYNRTFINKLF